MLRLTGCCRRQPDDTDSGFVPIDFAQVAHAVTDTQPVETLTVLYDGSCPLCRREISHLRGLAQQGLDSRLCFVDIADAQADPLLAADREQLLARFHVQRSDGTRLDGAAAFVAMWARLPGWRWLARLAQGPGMLLMLELAYRLFLKLRTQLQALAKYCEGKR
jgi:ubiquinone biosynthesis monooxygenase Coq7